MKDSHENKREKRVMLTKKKDNLTRSLYNFHMGPLLSRRPSKERIGRRNVSNRFPVPSREDFSSTTRRFAHNLHLPRKTTRRRILPLSLEVDFFFFFLRLLLFDCTSKLYFYHHFYTYILDHSFIN